MLMIRLVQCLFMARAVFLRVPPTIFTMASLSYLAGKGPLIVQHMYVASSGRLIPCSIQN